MSDIKQLTDEDIISAIDEANTVRTKILLTDFFKYVAKYESVKYHNIERRKKEVIQNRRIHMKILSDLQKYCLIQIMINSIILR